MIPTLLVIVTIIIFMYMIYQLSILEMQSHEWEKKYYETIAKLQQYENTYTKMTHEKKPELFCKTIGLDLIPNKPLPFPQQKLYDKILLANDVINEDKYLKNRMMEEIDKDINFFKDLRFEDVGFAKWCDNVREEYRNKHKLDKLIQ